MQAPKALILAANESGDELSSIAGNGAAHTIPVANRPLVAFAVRALRTAGIDDLGILICPASEEPVRRTLAGMPGLRATWIAAPERPSFADSLCLAADFLGDSPFVVHRGNAIVLDPLRPFVDDLVYGGADALLLRGAEGKNGRLRLVHGRSSLPADAELAGVQCFRPHALQAAAEVAELGTDDGPCAVAGELLQLGGDVETRAVAGSWNYHGSIDQLLEANRMVLDAMTPVGHAGERHGSRIEGRVLIHRSAELQRTTVRGPAVIGRGAVLTDAYIGPYSAIGDEVRIEGAEIEHSIIMAGATIRHPGHRVHASLVGEGATVSREFGLPASLRLRVGRAARVWLA